MTTSVVLVFVGLIFLYISKKFLVKELTYLIHHLGGNQKNAIITWSIIFLPGTITHEISHFLVAALTGARTGKIEIFPEYLEDELDSNKTKVSLGYVQTQSLNPVRGFLVGIAPFVSGVVLLIYLSSLIQDSYTFHNFYTLYLQGYFFFTIANSFFPSWSDIKQTLPLVVISCILLTIAWFMGFQLFFTPVPQVLTTLDSLSNAILASVVLNAIIIVVFSLSTKS